MVSCNKLRIVIVTNVSQKAVTRLAGLVLGYNTSDLAVTTGNLSPSDAVTTNDASAAESGRMAWSKCATNSS